ncbi:hypothetical protein M9Y10_036802 [Tritrichomonas musculus]|uniref:DUF3447 domain-containing protein n=1 Tax=Tritrichomonas musculus TaxID=1915356 RepID=A0ABR2GTV0_9EUKA
MFSFAFDKLSCQPSNWEIVINSYTIKCSRKNARLISPIISKYILEQKTEDSYKISIGEFENPLFCSESDYKYFDNIFNLVPIQIDSTNKDVLKIFATKFEIKELSSLIELFENYAIQISSNQTFQVLREISNKLINITEDDFESLLQDFQNVDKDILSQEFVYNLFLTICLVRPTKIELIMSFLQKLEEITKGGQFEYFKNLIIAEYKENETINEVKFLVSYLFSPKKLESIGYGSISNRYNEFYNRFRNNMNNLNGIIQKVQGEELEEYKKTGYHPSKIYRAIKDDDIDLFIEQITSKGGEINFNDEIVPLHYERSKDIGKVYDYLDLASFYGSEKIFNYILLNVGSSLKLENRGINLALIGGNISIVQKYFENVKMNDQLMTNYLLTTIKYHHNEIFEWLYENFDHRDLNAYLLIKIAIQFSNYEALYYILTNGLDYVSLFALSLIYNQFYLSELAIKFPYELNFSSKIIKNKCFYPFLYKYNDEPPLFIVIFKNRLDFVKLIIESQKFKPNVVFEGNSPLYFAVIHNKIDIVKFFLNDKRFLNKQVVKKINLFEYAICHGFTEIGELLLNHPNIEKMSEYVLSLIHIIKKEMIDKATHFSIYNLDSIDEIKNIVKFFLKKSDDDTTQNNKNKIIKQNITYFACMLARFSDEKEFEEFLDDYKININSTEEKTILFIFFFKWNYSFII